jgi:hypothetical protein
MREIETLLQIGITALGAWGLIAVMRLRWTRTSDDLTDEGRVQRWMQPNREDWRPIHSPESSPSAAWEELRSGGVEPGR